MYAKIGVPKNTAYAEVFEKWFPDHNNAITYEGSDLAFEALARGEIDMTIASLFKLLDLTNFREQPGYKANVVFDRFVESTLGFNINETVLCSVVDKALIAIDTEGIAEQWTRKTYDYRIRLATAQLPWIMGATAFGVMLLLLGAFIGFIFHRSRSENIRLNELVRERTAEATAASQAKSAFLASMSHEIRTPMNSIVGFSELALDNDIPQKTRDYLARILENSEWLLQIINDILDISKIESGKMELEKIPFDLREIFDACRAMIAPKAADKNLMLHFYAEPTTGRVPLGDPTRLRQVLVNLLSNAVKFTNNGKITSQAVIKNTCEESVVIYFEVSDNGIGMTDEQIKKIFDPFTQAESGTTRQYGGTGLGLSISKNIIEMMGGKLDVESAPGFGSKFSFELTFDTATADEKDLFEKRVSLDGMEKPTFEGEVLLCEDNVMNQQVACEHLARVGLRTAVAENGKVGVDMVRRRMESGEKQFNLIFMDMHMPVMDGLEAAGKILMLNTGVPIVALTANVMTSDRELYQVSGMTDYLGKPFTSQELWRCLMKYFTPIDWQPLNGFQYAQSENELRQKLTNNFLRNNQFKFNEISEAINAGDIKLAHRLVHTLKSNAGQLGKTSLQKAAETVENCLKDGVNLAAPGQMFMLESELSAVIESLTPLVNEISRTAGAVQDKPPDAEKLRKLLEKLEPLLEDGNSECLQLIDSLRLLPGSGELIRLMEDMEFETALAELKKIEKNA